MDDLATTIFLGCFLVGIIVCIIILLITIDKQNKENDLTKDSANSNDDPYKMEYKTVQINAKVIGQHCASKVVGIKHPKATKEFVVYFESCNGELFQLQVPEEIYDGFEKGQTGLLTMVDGNLYSFALDEDV